MTKSSVRTIPHRSGRSAAALLALGLLFAAIAQIASQPVHAKMFEPDSFTLDNGMQVVVITNHRAPLVTHMVWYKVGSMDEPPGRTGVSHLLEHLMFKGTKAYGPGEFSATVARNGGRENAFTGRDFTGYFQSVASDRLELMMEIESDRMTNLILSDEDIRTEAQVVLEERRSRIENTPGGRLDEQASAAIFLNHPYGNPVIGWGHEISALTRDDLLAYYRKWYMPNNATLVIAGDVTVDQVRPLAEKYYGRIPARDLPPRPDWREPPVTAAQRLTLADPQVNQPAWARRYRAPSSIYGATEHADALEVLSKILGGSTGRIYSRLVVEQKIAVSAGAYYSPSVRGPGLFSFYGSPPPDGTLEPIEAAVQVEIDTLLKDGVTADEVSRAVARLQADSIYARDALQTPAQVLGSGLTIGLTIEQIESWPERIGAVTVDEVNEAARAVLTNPATVTTLLLPADAGGAGNAKGDGS